MKRAGLAATIKARWICEQAHQQLKEKLGLDHFEGRSWQGLHRHALMTMIAYAFLQHRHLTQVGRKKESTDRRLSLACRPYATPSSISFFDHYLSNAHTAEDEAVKNSGVGKSAKVVLVRAARRGRLLRKFVLCDDRFEPGDVFQQALAGQDQEVIAELGVLKVDFEQLFVSDGQHVPVLGALDRRRPPVIGRKEAEFAHQTSRRKLNADFGDQE